MKELLNKKRSKVSTNKDNYMSLELGNQMKKISNHTDQHLIDVYQVYLDEKDASDKYRLIFTINPVCTNVLFNSITEIVKDEGSYDCFCIPETDAGEPDKDKYKNIISDEPITRIQAIRDTEYSNDRIMGLTYLPGIDIFNNHLIRQNGFNCVMKRTGRDCLKTGATYTLDEQYHFQKIMDIDDVFNTIRDYQRTIRGRSIIKKFPGADSTYLEPVKAQPHLYEDSEILDFESAFRKRLKEENGWFGFYNPSTLDIPIAKYIDEEGKEDPNIDIYVNKLINNKNSCDFIDMFPDRKRFTFVPQKNRFRNNRLEYNWEYCLTYPYAGTEYLTTKTGEPVLDDGGNPVLNPIVAEKDENGVARNGLSFVVIDELVTDSDKSRVLIQSTGSIHNLKPNSVINISYLDGGLFYEISDVTVKGLGDKNGEMQQYFFTIDSDDVPNWFDEEGKLLEDIKGRFRKTVFGIECKYYFRVFRKVPNFNVISKDEDRAYYIGKYNKPEYNFNSELNKLAFANNIYGDNLVQIVYLDDIDVNGLTDNYERPVSDIYLTIVKANNGHNDWYPDTGNPNYTADTITIARAFGKVTSGIDLPPEDNFSRDYNVHRIHNIDFKKVCEEYGDEFTRPYENLGNIDKNYNLDGDRISTNNNDRCLDKELIKPLETLEDDITIDQEFFLGDMVEFSLSEYQETILEPVYHRFNTAQREFVNKNFKDIVIDEIYMDDYEGSETGVTETIADNFKCIEDVYNYGYEDVLDEDNNPVRKLVSYPGNLFPEGYFYQPHYRVHLKDVSDKISQSSNTFVPLTEAGVMTGNTGTEVSFTTAIDVDLIKNDEIVIQDPLNNIFYEAVVVGATGVTGSTDIVASLKGGSRINEGLDIAEQPKSFIVFKKTLGIPKYALNYPDTGGKYIWRPLVAPSKTRTDSEIYDKPFTNGAHYRHIGINFFLKRQDPYGYYELNTKTEYSAGETNRLNKFMYSGRYNESIYYNDAIDFGLIDIC